MALMLIKMTKTINQIVSISKLTLFKTPTTELHYKGDHEIISLQVMKALAAFAVVMIHTSFFCKIELLPICRIAVPLFFMITGYFLLNEMGVLTAERIKRSFIKIFWLDVIATTLFLILSPECNVKNYIEHPTQIIPLITLGYNHLWYLHALLQALAFMYIALKIKLLPPHCSNLAGAIS
jgi:surface polysaccharide O-acyltransferase-like enzyme